MDMCYPCSVGAHDDCRDPDCICERCGEMEPEVLPAREDYQAKWLKEHP